MNPIIRHEMQEAENQQRKYDLCIAKRVMRDASDPFSLPDVRFRELFRLNKDLVQNMFIQLVPHMEEAARVTRICKQNRIIIALRFFATGAYQRGVGEEYLLSVSQQSVSRCLKEVSELMVALLSNQWIQFPQTDVRKNHLKTMFMEKAGFPGIIGCIDGTHVAMIAPNEDEHLFVNRKGFHSKNIQIICGHDLEIFNLNARYPGSTNDAFIWRTSAIYTLMDNNYAAGERNTWLLGDSGYPLQPWLMTPINDPAPNTPEAHYNNAHKVTRSTVERCIGVLKSRFRCILGERKLRYTPEKVGTIVYACGILHNMCIRAGIPMEVEPEERNVLEEVNNIPEINVNENILNEARGVQYQIINRYFRV